MTGTLVCETVTGADMRSLVAARDAVRDADLIELRLDGVAGVDAAGALAGRRLPVIVTCRPTWEGGRFDGAEEDRLALLRAAARHGADYVDVEWRADRRCLGDVPPHRVVLSHHCFDATPDDLADRVQAMRRESVGLVKIAITAAHLTDCLVLRSAVRDVDAVVAIAMGSAGLITRVHPAWCGSRWTYAGTAAPGQGPTRDLVESYRVRETSAASALYGVAGMPIEHSASPAMHNAAFGALGHDAVYVPLATGDARELATFARAAGLKGASVTAPLKRDAFAACDADALDDDSRTAGAVNTLRFTGTSVAGRNVDGAGFLAPLRDRQIDMRGTRVAVLGAGGAAAAAAAALVRVGAQVEICARNDQAARALAAQLGAAAGAWPPEPGWAWIVNATPVGTWPAVEDSPVDAARLAGGHGVYDLVYNPAPTRLLRDAAAAGLRTIGGLEMLVAQAALQFAWWTNAAPPVPVMRAAAARFVERMSGETR